MEEGVEGHQHEHSRHLLLHMGPLGGDTWTGMALGSQDFHR